MNTSFIVFAVCIIILALIKLYGNIIKRIDHLKNELQSLRSEQTRLLDLLHNQALKSNHLEKKCLEFNDDKLLPMAQNIRTLHDDYNCLLRNMSAMVDKVFSHDFTWKQNSQTKTKGHM